MTTSLTRPPLRDPDPTPPPATRRRWRARILWGLLVLVVLAAIPVAISYGRALTYPGQASFTARTVDWLRDHGGGPVVDAAENVYYSEFNAPTGSQPAAGSVPVASGPVTGRVPAPLAPTPGLAPLPGEGHWRPGPPVHGHPSGLWTTFVRPDAQHGSVVAGVARMDQSLLATRLVAGTREPSGLGWPEGGRVPPSLLGSLVATFNSGWKMADAHGGFMADGRTAVPLTNGAASLVIDRDGRARIGAWGRGVGPGPQVVAVRQNLDLVVDGGAAVPGLDGNANGRWGSSNNQKQTTWRSGVGIDADGDLVYVAGDKMTLSDLAAALVQAGAVEGMQLDIHPGMANLFTYAHGAGGPTPSKLLPDMPGTPGRYLVADQRDFVVVTAR